MEEVVTIPHEPCHSNTEPVCLIDHYRGLPGVCAGTARTEPGPRLRAGPAPRRSRAAAGAAGGLLPSRAGRSCGRTGGSRGEPGPGSLRAAPPRFFAWLPAHRSRGPSLRRPGSAPQPALPAGSRRAARAERGSGRAGPGSLGPPSASPQRCPSRPHGGGALWGGAGEAAGPCRPPLSGGLCLGTGRVRALSSVCSRSLRDTALWNSWTNMLGRRPKKSPQAKGQGAAVAKQVRRAKGQGDVVAEQAGKPPTPTAPQDSLVRTFCCCFPAESPMC